MPMCKTHLLEHVETCTVNTVASMTNNEYDKKTSSCYIILTSVPPDVSSVIEQQMNLF